MLNRGPYRTQPLTQNAQIYIDTRIDTKPIFSNIGNINDTSENRFIYLGRFSDPYRFISEAKKGSTIRMKIYFDNPAYINFSLHGFTAALNRAMSLVEVPDSAYFN
jgi:hypothetical protein